MENNIGVNLSGGSGTGVNTSNPQSGAANSSLTGPTQTLQTAASSGSINNQSSATPIQLQPADLRTAAVLPLEPAKTDHHVPVGGVAVVAVLIVVAVVMCIYISISAKQSSKNI
ncbi:MAG: hypothetical protein WDN66_05870 [Candidatus Saccharibacteria bacterium]